MSALPSSTTSDVDMTTVFGQLNTADYHLASLYAALKDPDKRQEIGISLLEMMESSFASGLVFKDIKLKINAGMLTASFKFPITDLKLPTPEEDPTSVNGQ